MLDTEPRTVFAPESTQDYGKNPIAVRESDRYVTEYVRGFVEKWDELIDWERRAKSEGRFFIDVLKARGKNNVLDVATGTGFHSVQLLRAGFDVYSVDGSAEMLAKAFENGCRHGVVLKTIHADWRWLNRGVHGKFDAIICLGNSFTHLFEENDRRRALAEFYAALKHDGILILDQRNYDRILDGGVASRHKYYYCGDQVTAQPVHVDEGLARFEYIFPDGSRHNLNMFPLRKDYMRRLLREAGFQQIHSYGPDTDIRTASRRTVEDMAAKVAPLAGKRVLDLGAGYGGAARVLAGEHGARVSCLNLSMVENARNRLLNRQAGLSERIDVVDGSFDEVPFGDQSFDVAWSQDAILHAPDRRAVLNEVARVLKPGGAFIFTDPMQADGLSDKKALRPIYDRIHLPDLASFGFYRAELKKRGFRELSVEDLTGQLRIHYARIAEELNSRRGEIGACDEFIERMLAGLDHWVSGADAGLLVWGVMHFQKAP